MGISANPIAIWLAALVGSVATAAFGQSSPVLMGAAAYGDWRGDAPGVRRKITPADMPPPYATASANNGPTVAQRPPNAWPKAPPRFVVQLLATGLDNPRLIRVSPSGDVFIAESRPGRIRVFRAAQGGGKPEIRIFAEDLYQPFGIAFWPPGPNPRYVYIANTDSVLRFPYRSGDLQPAGPAETIVTALPQGGHSTRDVLFSADGTRMFVSVGSRSNVGERPIYAPWQSDADRALVLAFTPEGRDQRFYATGLRNCVSASTQKPRTRHRVQIALRLRAFGGPENFELTDVPEPAIRPGIALIRVDATSVNQIDVRIRSGQVPIGPDLPTILGADVAGTIEEVGAGVLDFAPGDEVYGCAGAPHGLPITHQQQLNADLLAFIKS